MSETLYKPSRWQLEFHGLDVDEALGAGAAGVGKTYALLMDAVIVQARVEHDRCMVYEAWKRGTPKQERYGAQFDRRPEAELLERYGSAARGWTLEEYGLEWGQSRGWALHLRRELTELTQTMALAASWFTATDPRRNGMGVRFDRDNHMFIFSSGFRYQFGHCKDTNDHIRYLGSSYTHLAFDELTTFSKEQYDAITLRLRTGDPVLIRMLRTRACTNPGVSPGSDQQWVRRMFVDPCPEGRRMLVRPIKMADGTVEERTRVFLPGRLTDNPDKSFKRMYERQIRDKPRHLIRAYLDGDWDFIDGTFFGEDIDPALHVIPPRKMPRDWPVFRMMDWGYKTQGCVLWAALTDDEDLIVFEEFWFKLMSDAEVAKSIKRIETGLGYWDKRANRSLLTGPADTQLWEERGDSAKRKVDVFHEHGVPWVQADKKSREDNAQRVLFRLKDHGNGTTDPGLMFTSNCPRVVRTTRQLLPDQEHPEEPKKSGDDHGYDALSYGVAYAAAGRHGIPPPRFDDDDERGDDDDRESISGGRFGYGSAYR